MHFFVREVIPHQYHMLIQGTIIFLIKQLEKTPDPFMHVPCTRCNMFKSFFPCQCHMFIQTIVLFLKQPEQTPDCFIVHKENYHRLREAFGKATLTGSTDELHVLLQVSTYILCTHTITSLASQISGQWLLEKYWQNRNSGLILVKQRFCRGNKFKHSF